MTEWDQRTVTQNLEDTPESTEEYIKNHELKSVEDGAYTSPALLELMMNLGIQEPPSEPDYPSWSDGEYECDCDCYCSESSDECCSCEHCCDQE